MFMPSSANKPKKRTSHLHGQHCRQKGRAIGRMLWLEGNSTTSTKAHSLAVYKETSGAESGCLTGRPRPVKESASMSRATEPCYTFLHDVRIVVWRAGFLSGKRGDLNRKRWQVGIVNRLFLRELPSFWSINGKLL